MEGEGGDQGGASGQDLQVRKMNCCDSGVTASSDQPSHHTVALAHSPSMDPKSTMRMHTGMHARAHTTTHVRT